MLGVPCKFCTTFLLSGAVGLPGARDHLPKPSVVLSLADFPCSPVCFPTQQQGFCHGADITPQSAPAADCFLATRLVRNWQILLVSLLLRMAFCSPQSRIIPRGVLMCCGITAENYFTIILVCILLERRLDLVRPLPISPKSSPSSCRLFPSLPTRPTSCKHLALWFTFVETSSNCGIFRCRLNHCWQFARSSLKEHHESMNLSILYRVALLKTESALAGVKRT